MNDKTILDGELIVHPLSWTDKDGTVRRYDTTVKVSPKTLTFQDRNYTKNRIKFTKKASAHMDESLHIESYQEDVAPETCNMGHVHEDTRRERVYQWWTIDWEHVQSLIEWLQLGSWTEVKRSEKPEKKLLREVNEFLMTVEKTNEHLKPMSQRLRNKIRVLI